MWYNIRTPVTSDYRNFTNKNKLKYENEKKQIKLIERNNIIIRLVDC